MKKTLLFLIAACTSILAFGQNTVDIYAASTVGSYVTGNSTNTTRTDNVIQSSIFRRGYAVFDLSSIPATAVVTSVELNFNLESVSAGGGSGWTTCGYVGDLSSITTAGPLYAAMDPASLDTLYEDAYGTPVGNKTFPSDVRAENFVDANLGSVITVVWTTRTFRQYTMTGETGTATTTGFHAPYLRITYNCPYVSGVMASGPAVAPCPNAAFSLSGSATGEIAGYQWTGPLGYTSTEASPTISTGLPSSATYTLAVTDTSGCTIKTTALATILPNPPTYLLTYTSTAFCNADSVILYAPVAAGNTYQWYDGSTPIAGATDTAYISRNTGNYAVEITDANGCTDMTGVATPTVMLDTPAVTPEDSLLLCMGDNGTLEVNTNGITSGLGFQWQKDGVDIPGALSNTHLASVSGVYRCMVTVTAGTCTATSKEVVVEVNDYPIPVVSYSGFVLSTSNIYAGYQWFLNTVAIPGATSASFVPTTAGNYRVRVVDLAGCIAFSTGYPVSIVSVGVSSINNISVRLFPNPTNGVLHIESPVPVDAVISSLDGKVVGEYNGASQINLHSLSAGIYVVNVYTKSGERILVEKLVKE